jgi:hypothetical protein
LDKEPNTRLGTQRGVEEILEHPFFSEFTAEKMIEKKVIDL